MFSQAALILALGAAVVHAQQTLGNIGSQCPSGWSTNNIGDSNQLYCCPGSGIQIDNMGACCIGIGTMGPEQSCSTTVAYDDPNYSSIVSSLAAQTESGSSPSTNTGSTMTMTDSSSSMTTSMSESSETTMASSGSAAAQSSASSTSSGAGVAITAGPILANMLMGAAGAAMLL